MAVLSLLGLNIIYVLLHTGNMFIGKNYSFVVDKSMLLSFGYVMALTLSGYAILHFLSKRVAWNAARIVLDDFSRVYDAYRCENKFKPIIDK